MAQKKDFVVQNPYFIDVGCKTNFDKSVTTPSFSECYHLVFGLRIMLPPIIACCYSIFQQKIT